MRIVDFIEGNRYLIQMGVVQGYTEIIVKECGSKSMKVAYCNGNHHWYSENDIEWWKLIESFGETPFVL